MIANYGDAAALVEDCVGGWSVDRTRMRPGAKGSRTSAGSMREEAAGQIDNERMPGVVVTVDGDKQVKKAGGSASSHSIDHRRHSRSPQLGRSLHGVRPLDTRRSTEDAWIGRSLASVPKVADIFSGGSNEERRGERGKSLGCLLRLSFAKNTRAGRCWVPSSLHLHRERRK